MGIRFEDEAAKGPQPGEPGYEPPLRVVGADERAPTAVPLENLGPSEWIGATYFVADRPEWMQSLRWSMAKKKTGPAVFTLLPTAGNLSSILANDPRWSGVLQYNEFAERERFIKPPPWHPNDCAAPRIEDVRDEDAARLGAWFDRAYQMKVSKDMCFSLLAIGARNNGFHPVRAYLLPLQWDGVPRIDSWLTQAFGAEDTAINRVFGAKWLIAAVARVMEPGCKVDTVLILEGEQGIKKSSGLELLAGGPEFFAELHGDLNEKDTLQLIQGKWIAEVSELSSMKRSDTESAKRFFSARVDRYRPSFGRKTNDYPRQIVFAGSTNAGESGYLTDSTGNRRYWPVACVEVDRGYLEAHRDQLWAEALHRYRQGGAFLWWLSPEEDALARGEQVARVVPDEWESKIATWVDGLMQRPCKQFSNGELLEKVFALEPAKWGQMEQQRIGRCMRKLGWKRHQLTGGARVYRRP